MPTQSQLPPGEIKILQSLQKPAIKEEQPPIALIQPLLKSYTELKEETGLSDPVMSDYLKDLQKKGFIKRDIDTRKYFMTGDRGQAALRIAITVECLNDVMAILHKLSKEKLEKLLETLTRFRSDLPNRLVEQV